MTRRAESLKTTESRPPEAVTVEGLGVDYGDFRAVDDVSFTVHHGEVLALLGTNGAGKTTTLDVLGGFLTPTAGTVRVLGHDPRRDRAPIASRIGTVLQDAGFFSELTVRETVRAWQRFTANARPVDEALALVDLQSRARTRVRRLSGGEKRRLDLALAVLGAPELLFLDEPTTGLDPEARHRTWEMIAGLVRGGTTVLLTTHYMEEAEFLASRAVILDHGRAVMAGDIAEIVRAAALSRVTFRLPDRTTEPALPDAITLGGAPVRSVDGELTVETADAQRTLHALLQWADEQGVHLAELEARPASLEDVFLGIARDGDRLATVGATRDGGSAS